MKFRTYRKVKWSDLELTGLAEDEESHVHFTRTIKHLALHPYHLNNVQRGLNQILRSSLNSYDKEYVFIYTFFTHKMSICDLSIIYILQLTSYSMFIKVKMKMK